MIRHQATRGLGFALALLLGSSAPTTTALGQTGGGPRSVDGSHTGVGYKGLELDGGVVGSQPGGIGSAPASPIGGPVAPPATSIAPVAPAPAATTPTQPATRPALAAPARPASTSLTPAARSGAPYLTTRTYEPGDGYRYPLYYNPATRGYFYHPVRR